MNNSTSESGIVATGKIAQSDHGILSIISEVHSNIEDLGLGVIARQLQASMKLLGEADTDVAEQIPFVIRFLRKGNAFALEFAQRLEALLVQEHGDTANSALMAAPQPVREEAPTASAMVGAAKVEYLSATAHVEAVTHEMPKDAEPVAVALPQADEVKMPVHNLTVSVAPTDKHVGSPITEVTPNVSVKDDYAEDVPFEIATDDITISAPFDSILGIDRKSYPLIEEDMKKRRFDKAEPVTLMRLNGRLVLIDGHQRILAAKATGQKTVWAILKAFSSLKAAMLFAVRKQTHRRNASDGQRLQLLALLDVRKAKGGDRRSEAARIKASGEATGRSANETAAALGTSRTDVEKLRLLRDSGDEGLIKDVETGRSTLNKAVTKLRAENKAKEAGVAPSAHAKVAAELLHVSKLIGPLATKVRELDPVVADEVAAAGKVLRDASARIAKSGSAGAGSGSAETKPAN